MPYSLLYAKAIATGSAILMGGLGIDKVIGRPSRTHYFVRGSSDKDDLSLGHHHSSKGHPSYSHSGSQSDDTSFDFYIYTMTYQPEFCRENSSRSFAGCQKPDEFWEGQLTIHGLWPERNDGSWPASCTSERFDTELISSDTDLNSKLEQKWPNVKAALSSSSHTEFWSHEWSKHGTCSGLTQEDYFSSALDMLLPTPALVKSGYGSVVKKEELIEEYGGPTMAIAVCKSGYLTEVRVCFGKEEGGEPGERMECPDVVLKEGSCGDDIKIASFGMKGTTSEIM